MAILLIRHGETAGNRDRVIQRPDTPLSERGLEQAERLAARLAALPLGEIWTSPHARARMTAERVGRATGLALHEVPDLEERNLGALRGTPYAELDFDPFALDYVPPGGESWPAFHERVDRAWQRVERHWLDRFAALETERHLAVVSHGLFLKSLLQRRLLEGDDLARHADANGQVAMANTGVTVLEPRAAGDAAAGFRIERVGCTAHLDAEPVPGIDPAVLA